MSEATKLDQTEIQKLRRVRQAALVVVEHQHERDPDLSALQKKEELAKEEMEKARLDMKPSHDAFNLKQQAVSAVRKEIISLLDKYVPDSLKLKALKDAGCTSCG